MTCLVKILSGFSFCNIFDPGYLLVSAVISVIYNAAQCQCSDL